MTEFRLWVFLGFLATYTLCIWEIKGWDDDLKATDLALSQQKTTIAAEQQVIVKEQKADAITRKAENDYESEVSTFSSVYDNDSVYHADSPASNGMRSVPTAASGTCPATLPWRTKIYHLTRQECDEVKAGFDTLWDDWQAQVE